MEPEHLLSAQNKLGESPIWSPEESALYWVDWSEGSICKYEPATRKFETFSVNLPVTALARQASGRWIIIALNGLYEWNQQLNEYKKLAGPPEADRPHLCYNDGAVDRQGRLLVGTVNMQDVFAPDGSLYCLGVDGSFDLLDTGYATANGIGISPDGKKVYVTDMRHHQIIAYDYDTAEGTVSNRHIFAHIPEEEGMPDGLIVDAEGSVWSGHWAGWRLTKYGHTGKIERQIHFPVEHVISFAFGGSGLDELFVTTAWWGFNEEERKKQPWAGDLFHIKTDSKGLIEPAFGGKQIY